MPAKSSTHCAYERATRHTEPSCEQHAPPQTDEFDAAHVFEAPKYKSSTPAHAERSRLSVHCVRLQHAPKHVRAEHELPRPRNSPSGSDVHCEASVSTQPMLRTQQAPTRGTDESTHAPLSAS